VDRRGRCQDGLHRGRQTAWENGYFESFNARLPDELLYGEVFYTLREAQIIIESRRRHCNAIRPHAPLGYRMQALEVFVPGFTAWLAALNRQAPPATPAQPPAPNQQWHLDH
jgi:transposase InsO family protein